MARELHLLSRWRRLLAGLCLCLVLVQHGCAACRSYSHAWRLVLSRFEFTEASSQGLVIVDIRHHCQPSPVLCGPTAVATVMSYYQPQVPYGQPGAPANADIEQQRLPWTLGQLADLARRKGFEAKVCVANENCLREWLDSGLPPVLAVEEPIGNYHALVAAGYYMDSGGWVVEDPAFGFRRMSAEHLSEAWSRTGRACVVIVPSCPQIVGHGAGNGEQDAATANRS